MAIESSGVWTYQYGDPWRLSGRVDSKEMALFEWLDDETNELLLLLIMSAWYPLPFHIFSRREGKRNDAVLYDDGPTVIQECLGKTVNAYLRAF